MKMGDESSPTNPSVPGDSFVIVSRNFIAYKYLQITFKNNGDEMFLFV